MAAKKDTKQPKSKPLPKGFIPAMQKLDGFFEKAVGNTVQGILRGNFETKGKFGAKRVYRVEIVEGETQVADGEMIGPGGVIGIDETGYTRVLSDLDPGTGIFVRYEGKAGPAEKDPHVFTVGKAG